MVYRARFFVKHSLASNLIAFGSHHKGSRFNTFEEKRFASDTVLRATSSTAFFAIPISKPAELGARNVNRFGLYPALLFRSRTHLSVHRRCLLRLTSLGQPADRLKESGFPSPNLHVSCVNPALATTPGLTIRSSRCRFMASSAVLRYATPPSRHCASRLNSGVRSLIHYVARC